MALRDQITAALKDAMKAKDAPRLSTLRLITAAIKDRDIGLRSEGRDDGVTEAEIQAILARMVKQRQESARTYEEAARLELAESERAEIGVIEEFLPRQLSQAEVAKAIDAAVAELGATSIRDMGRVMALLKERHAGQMDFAAAGALVKARLSNPA
jgi:uncharacterized protein YqeY